MKPVLIIRHIACEGPGYFGTALTHANIPWTVCAIDAGESLPSELDSFSGIAAMGGPMSVNDDMPWIVQELALLHRAHELGMPLLGHCLGGQMLSKALGGQVTRNPVKEIGWWPVSRATSVPVASWLTALPQTFDAFHWHGETFSIPAGAVRVLGSAACANQAFVIGNTLGLQCHIEVTRNMIDEWATLYADEIRAPTGTIQSHAAMRDNAEQRLTALHRVADGIYGDWIALIKSRI